MSTIHKKKLKTQEAELVCEIDILLTEVKGLLELVEQKEQEIMVIRDQLSSNNKQQSAAA